MRVLICALIFLMQGSFARAQDVTTPMSWHPDSIVWQEYNPDGTKYALLQGLPDQPGVALTYAFFIPAGVWDAPHWHPTTARVAVVKGTLRLGYGDILDKDATRRYPTGSYLVVPGNVPHFDGADEETMIIGTAVGPWTTQYVQP